VSGPVNFGDLPLTLLIEPLTYPVILYSFLRVLCLLISIHRCIPGSLVGGVSSTVEVVISSSVVTLRIEMGDQSGQSDLEINQAGPCDHSAEDCSWTEILGLVDRQDYHP